MAYICYFRIVLLCLPAILEDEVLPGLDAGGVLHQLLLRPAILTISFLAQVVPVLQYSQCGDT